MTHPFPHHYTADLTWQEGMRADLTSGSRPSLVGGSPPEFGGDPVWWSPEHLLLCAANLCLMTTFFALNRKTGCVIESYRSRAEGTLEKTKDGLVFTRIVLNVSIQAQAPQEAEVRKTLESAKGHCLVSKALKRPVEVEVSIVTASDAHPVVDA